MENQEKTLSLTDRFCLIYCGHLARECFSPDSQPTAVDLMNLLREEFGISPTTIQQVALKITE